MMADVLRYPPSSLLGDYARALAGLAFTALPLALLDVGVWVAVPMAAAAALFAVFGARTVQRQLSRLTVDETGVRVDGPFGAAVRWEELRRLDLRYYSTKRDRTGGWMQARLQGSGRPVRIDSTLDGFDAVVERALNAAQRNGVALSQVTMDNLLALGIDPEEPPR